MADHWSLIQGGLENVFQCFMVHTGKLFQGNMLKLPMAGQYLLLGESTLEIDTKPQNEPMNLCDLPLARIVLFPY